MTKKQIKSNRIEKNVEYVVEKYLTLIYLHTCSRAISSWIVLGSILQFRQKGQKRRFILCVFKTKELDVRGCYYFLNKDVAHSKYKYK